MFKATQMITRKFYHFKGVTLSQQTCRFEIFLNIIIKIRFRPYISKLKVDIQLVFLRLSQNVCIDERMIGFKGRHFLKQYLANYKAHIWEVKAWVLALMNQIVATHIRSKYIKANRILLVFLMDKGIFNLHYNHH